MAKINPEVTKAPAIAPPMTWGRGAFSKANNQLGNGISQNFANTIMEKIVTPKGILVDRQ